MLLLIAVKFLVLYSSAMESSNNEENTTTKEEEHESIFTKCCRWMILIPLSCCVLCLCEITGDGVIADVIRCLCPCCCKEDHLDEHVADE